MKWQAAAAVLLVTMIIACESFLYPPALAVREHASNDSTADNDETGGAEAEQHEEEEEEQESGSGQEEGAASRVINWKTRRQFNSALGIGIDAPAAQPQTNAYDVHNQQGRPPWESSSNNNQEAYYYYYYYDDDAPSLKRKSRRQPLKPEAGRIMPAVKRAHRPRPVVRPHHVADARRRHNNQQRKLARGRPAKMDFRLGQRRGFAKWKKSQK